MSEQARVRVSLREGKIEISGSEKFVKDQLDRFQDLIDGKLSSLPAVLPVAPAQLGGGVEMPPQASTGNTYPNVIAIEDDEIKILKKIPGKNKAEKTINAALLCLVGAGIKRENTVPFATIREICKNHSCLDSTNFSSTMKGAKELFIISGSGKNKTAKLTHPGKTKAHELAAELNA